VNRNGTRKKVVILGGGVAGMSAAHELVERGFQVEVFERKAIAGGKARSIAVPPPSGRPGPFGAPSFMKATPDPPRPWLPGEHGFRFFPRFYMHIVDTMSRIPYGSSVVSDNLVETTQVHVARFDRPPLYLPARFPRTVDDIKTALFAAIAVLSGQVEVPLGEAVFFADKMWRILTSCEERRFSEYERINWWDFIEADGHSPGYQKYFGSGITRSLVAAKARRASTKTIGDIFLQIVFDILRPGISADRVLNGPTNDVWINPWLEYLRARGVVYHLDADVRAVQCERGVVRAARVAVGNRIETAEGDYFIGALPVERMAELLSPELLAADASLANLNALTEYVEWMNGIQFYLTEDVPLAHGHTIYVDSPWALTSISQQQFWGAFDLTRYADGKVKGLISVDASDWDVKGLNGKEARHCSRSEIAAEVWEQLKRSVNCAGQCILRDEQLHSWFLDPDISAADPTTPGLELNAEPLLVNYVDTWRLRPEATTRIPNFFLASDYVRTYTDLATMEAANEAARRAVNGILRACDADVAPCELWNPQEPEVFLPLRAYDRIRFRKGLPWDGGAMGLVNATLGIVGQNDGLPDGLSQALHDIVGQVATVSGVVGSSDEGLVNTPESGADLASGAAQRSEAETAAAARSSSDVGLRQLRILR
jgi:uncharacterized protein with NAD-binding domain and iron-sulfur cluster